MSNFVSSLTVSTVILGILVISAIWFIRRLFSKEKRFALTFFILILLCMAAFFYLDSNDMEKMTLSEFSEMIFASDEPTSYSYRIEEGYHLGKSYTRYAFNKPLPRLNLVMDQSGKYFTMKNVKSLNRVLAYIGLPKVNEGRSELISITGKKSDIYSFQWDNYPSGILLVKRTICDETVELTTPHCLSSITLLR